MTSICHCCAKVRGEQFSYREAGRRDPSTAALPRGFPTSSLMAAPATVLNQARAALLAAGRSTEFADWTEPDGLDMIELIRAADLDGARERWSSCLSLSLD
jgi:hypothetical protein